MNSLQKLEMVSQEVYFAYDESIEGWAEYFNGKVADLPPSSPLHSNLSANLAAELVNATRGNGSKVYNISLRVEAGNSFLHPGITVISGKLEISKVQKDTVRNPLLIVEILSDATAVRDWGEKFEQYKLLDSLREYVLVEQTVPQIYVFTKSVGGDWVYHVFTGMAASVKLNSLEISIPLANIYFDVKFPDPTQAQQP